MSTHNPHQGPPPVHPGAPAQLGVGSVLAGRYRVTGVLGEGGMGSVFLAEHIALGKRVALKVLKAELAHEQSLVERFFREARATAAIQHENIVEILDFGQDGSTAYFAMEALQGCELADLLGPGRRLSWARAKPIIVQIARGLAAAHRMNVVHRDMKPGNVYLIRKDAIPDFVKILDFGIAKIEDGRKLTRAGMVFGTAAYMAPEQASGGQLDGRADQYALGCMIYEMLTGAPPFPGEVFMKVIADHIGKPAPRLRDAQPPVDVPAHVLGPLDDLLARMLEKFPEPRFEDMGTLEQAVLALDGALPPGLSTAAPLPPALLGADAANYRDHSVPPGAAAASSESSSSGAQSTQWIPSMGGASLDSHHDPERRALAPLAYLYVAFAHGADGELTTDEMRLLADSLRRWAPRVGLHGVGEVLREAVSAYRQDHSSARLAQVRAQLAESHPSETLTRIAADLRAIAEVDGALTAGEQRFMTDTAKAFGLEGDRRMRALALLFLIMGSVTEGKIGATEMRVLADLLRRWTPGASTSETAAVLREAADEYKALPDPPARLARAHAEAEFLHGATDHETLRRILGDLWSIAGADGVISPAEHEFFTQTMQRFGLS